jgi:nucleoside-diphosphate-sugar epimerase
MNSDFPGPVNIGSEEMVSINQLAQLVIDISGKNLSIKNIPGPEGVRGRNSDNTLIREKLNWNYQQSLKQGIEITYNWIFKQVSENRYKENDLKILLKIGSVKK